MTIAKGMSSVQASTRSFFAVLLLFSVCLACSVDARAQADSTSAADIEPPVIELEELADGVADSSQVFTVQVAEDNELADVTFFYRRIGQEAFESASMLQVASSEFYSATIETDADDLRPIEYYIQARDISGNRTVKGFAFDPFIRSLAPAAVPVTPAEPSVEAPPAPTTEPASERVVAPTVAKKSLFQRRWFQVTLGVIAAGVIASSIDTDSEDSQQVPVTITLEQ